MDNPTWECLLKLACLQVQELWNSMRLTYLIVESLSHSDGASWEVRIVILTLPQLYTRWRVTVPGQQCKDVVLKQTKSFNNNNTVYK